MGIDIGDIHIPTPELDKQHAIQEQADTIGRFIDWMIYEGYDLGRRYFATVVEKCPSAWPEGKEPQATNLCCIDGKLHSYWDGKSPRWVPTGRTCGSCQGKGTIEFDEERYEDMVNNPEKTMARYFDIDLRKIEQERRAILKTMQEANG